MSFREFQKGVVAYDRSVDCLIGSACLRFWTDQSRFWGSLPTVLLLVRSLFCGSFTAFTFRTSAAICKLYMELWGEEGEEPRVYSSLRSLNLRSLD